MKSAEPDPGLNFGGYESPIDKSKREFLRAAAVWLAGLNLPKGICGKEQQNGPAGTGQKVVVVIFGGVRRAETFTPEGLENIPHLSQDLMPRSIFYPYARNDGVTAHFNAISSILTGNWQRVDDWGKLAPTTPTLFEHFRKQLGASRDDTWIVASNKALTSQIGASSANDYGPAYGANVVFPKQLMIAAVVKAIRTGHSRDMANRTKIENELETMLESGNYEGLGWSVSGQEDRLDPRFRGAMEDSIIRFVRSGGPTSGDELTFLMTREIMREFSPRLLVVVFSDVEVAHFGSYSLHVAGIRTGDRLTYQLWQEIETNAEYQGKTTMVVMPEFGRDPDRSTTNGFFNHRSDSDSTRLTWAMVLGSAVDKPRVIERPVRHVDLCPTLGNLLGCPPLESQGVCLPELHA